MSTFKCSECGCAESTGTSNGQLDQIKNQLQPNYHWND